MAKKYKSIVAYRSECFKIAELPQTEVPVTLNFDDSKVVGKAKLHFDEKMNIVADIEMESESMLHDLMTPAISMMKSGENSKVIGVSIVQENIDPLIGRLGGSPYFLK